MSYDIKGALVAMFTGAAVTATQAANAIGDAVIAYVADPPTKAKFNAHQGTITTLTQGTRTKVLMDHQVSDAGGDYDEANSKFVAPRNNYYHFDVCVGVASLADAQSILVRMMIDGATADDNAGVGPQQTPGAAGNSGCSYSRTIYLTTGQQVEVYVFLAAGTNRDTQVTGSTWWSGFEL